MDIEIGEKLVNSNNFWLKKRLLFNFLVGIFGLLTTLKFTNLMNSFDYIGIIIWGIVANVFYSFGYVLESFIIKKSNGKKDLSKNRIILFWLGTICYIIITVYFANFYFYYIISPF